LAPVGPSWPQLAPSWPQLAPVGPSWPQLAPVGPSLPQFAPVGPSSPQFTPVGPSWPQLAPVGPSWPQLAPVGPSRPQLAPVGPSWTQLDPGPVSNSWHFNSPPRPQARRRVHSPNVAGRRLRDRNSVIGSLRCKCRPRPNDCCLNAHTARHAQLLGVARDQAHVRHSRATQASQPGSRSCTHRKAH